MFLKNEDVNKIVEFLVEKLQPNFIYLFGSFARGEGREDSDIDVAVHVDGKIDEYELFTLANELSFIVKRDVQLINLKDISTVFSAQIVGTREIIYSIEENKRIEYEIRAFKDYAKLNEERQVVLDAIKKDGKIYG
ncbi:type VII toxin-antitoxin system MntA family adenylyltransferase antitoxin [Clostridium sp. Marseille-Q7071]